MNMQPLHENFKMPTRATDGSAGYDIYMPVAGFADGSVHRLGFAAEIPAGYAMKIYPRSSLGIKKGLFILNTIPLIDSDYRGELMLAVGCRNGVYEWSAGERIAQFTLEPVHTPELAIVGSLDNTTRGIGGIGSTGR